jgi:hypothetical protein
MPRPALQARYFDENASTRCCAGVSRTLGMLPECVKKFVSPFLSIFFFTNHMFAQNIASRVKAI